MAKKKTEALTPRRKARRELPSQIPKPTDAQHKLAQEGMAPYLDEFQRAADEQTSADFGIPPSEVRAEAFRLWCLKNGYKQPEKK